MRCAIVTGAGTGIGAAVVQRLHGDGHGIVLTGRRREPLETVAREFDEALVVEADVGDPGDAERTVAAAVERFGGVDVLVNNAGVGDSAPVLEETPEGTGPTLRARTGSPTKVIPSPVRPSPTRLLPWSRFSRAATPATSTASPCRSTEERPQSTPRRSLFARKKRKFRPTRNV